MENKQSKKKKRYESPRVESKEIYEVNALGCGKCPGQGQAKIFQQACLASQKFS